VESRSSRKRAAITRTKYRRDAIWCNTIKPPSKDKRPASNVAASDLAPKGDGTGRNGVAGMAMSAGSGDDAHASASPDSYGNPAASSPRINLHCAATRCRNLSFLLRGCAFAVDSA
jgi:hypothetical protein